MTFGKPLLRLVQLTALLWGTIWQAEAQNAYPTAKGWEYLLSPGTAVLEGRITDTRTGTPPKTFTVNVENIFDGSERMILVEPDKNGNFRTEIPLPYPQFVFVDPIDNLFLFPGDTLCCKLYTGSDSLVFTGNNTSAQVNRKWRELKPRYFQRIATPYDMFEQGAAELLDYRDRLVRFIDRFAKEIKKGIPPEWKVESPVVADILKTLVIDEAFYRIVQVEANYQGKHNGQKEGTFEALDERKYFDFLKERQDLLLDNPLMLCSSTQGVLFNQLEFGIYRGIYFYANRLPKLTVPASLSQATLRYLVQFVLPREYDERFLREVLPWRGDTLFTGVHYYTEVLKDIEEKYGINNTFMFQMLLVKSVFSRINDEPDMPSDVFAAMVADMLPFVTHPIVSRQVVERYRQYVIHHEGTKEDVSQTPKADSILQRIIAPYKGDVLYLDFWGIGCGPCRTGMLNQREIVEEMKDLPVRFLYLCQDERPAAEKFLQKNNIRGEHIFLTPDEWNFLSAKFNFSAIPFQVIIDRQGNIHPYPAFTLTREALKEYINQ